MSSPDGLTVYRVITYENPGFRNHTSVWLGSEGSEEACRFIGSDADDVIEHFGCDLDEGHTPTMTAEGYRLLFKAVNMWASCQIIDEDEEYPEDLYLHDVD